MHYIIDGYNLLFKKTPPSKFLKKARDELLFLLKKVCTSQIHFTIVFDSKEKDTDAHTLKHGYVKVIYAQNNLTAEEHIYHLLTERSSYKNVTVVSSDNYLIKKCRMLGCSNMGSNSFLHWLYNKVHGKFSNDEIVEFQESKIQSERLEKIFLERLKYFDSSD